MQKLLSFDPSFPLFLSLFLSLSSGTACRWQRHRGLGIPTHCILPDQKMIQRWGGSHRILDSLHLCHSSVDKLLPVKTLSLSSCPVVLACGREWARWDHMLQAFLQCDHGGRAKTTSRRSGAQLETQWRAQVSAMNPGYLGSATIVKKKRPTTT